MLLLLKPWRSVEDLIGEHPTWTEPYTEFHAVAAKPIKSFIANIQHFHRCKDAADRAREDSQNAREEGAGSFEDEYDIEDGELGSVAQTMASLMPTDKEWRELEISRVPKEAHENARIAVFQGERCKFFTNDAFVHHDSSKNAEGDDYTKLARWLSAMKSQSQEGQRHTGEGERRTSVGTVNCLDGALPTGAVDYIDEPGRALEPISLEHLNKKQKQIYDMVRWVKKERDRGRSPPQMLLLVHGEGGTGKSRVIQTISEIYKREGDGRKLAKIAYTGIAASIIEGETIHRSIRIIPNTSNHITDRVKEELQARWGNKQLLIIDEISMVPKEMLATISNRIQQGRAGLNPTDLPFGGIDVILCGDFHQFPPVARKRNACLYSRERGRHASEYESLCLQGRNIYEQFNDCIILREQMRVQDPEWLAFLRRLRGSGCASDDIVMLKTLIVNESSHELGTEEWRSAKLVTPRHIAKDLWNKRALENYSTRTGKQIYQWESEKTVHGEPVDGRTCYELEKHKQGRRGGKMQQPRFLAICEGADVMVTVNLDTDIDLANGTRGIVEKIVLADNEPPVGTEQVVKLKRMPLYILVRLEKTRALQVEGLDPNVIPIAPFDTKHYLKYSRNGVARSETVVERQFPFILGYAFTDYRSQGQTLPKVIVDLATPPTGKAPTLFNFYVALSRSTGRTNIRLLRDFDQAIFREALPVELMDEDDRLDTLDSETEQKWNEVQRRRYV
jgi:hypothetical protein